MSAVTRNVDDNTSVGICEASPRQAWTLKHFSFLRWGSFPERLDSMLSYHVCINPCKSFIGFNFIIC